MAGAGRFRTAAAAFWTTAPAGVKLREYAHNREQVLKWPEVEKRIRVLSATGQYLDEREAEKPAASGIR